MQSGRFALAARCVQYGAPRHPAPLGKGALRTPVASPRRERDVRQKCLLAQALDQIRALPMFWKPKKKQMNNWRTSAIFSL